MNRENESSVRQLIDDISDSSNLYRTLHEFSQRLTKMHKDLVEAEGQYLITPGQADEITVQYCESFLYAILKTLKAREQSRRK